MEKGFGKKELEKSVLPGQVEVPVSSMVHGSRPGKLYIENLGCAKNQVDAEIMAHCLEKDGWELTDEASGADLIIVNTCGFIDSAKEESVNTFFSLKRQYPEAAFILSGCLAQRYAEELAHELTEADAVFGNRDISQINGLVKQVCSNRQADCSIKEISDKPADKKGSGGTGLGNGAAPVLLKPEYPDPDSETYTRGRLFNYPGSAYLKISEGCNHRCGYCAIPLIRGGLRSIPAGKVIAEARRLVKSGIKEINLIAQDLAAYGSDFGSGAGSHAFCGENTEVSGVNSEKKTRFPDLLRELDSIEGDFRIRMLYIHPDWLTDEIIRTIKDCSKVLPYFDIPFQHASPKLLRPMNRTGDPETYARLVEKIKEEFPNAVIRTTIMLGFPGDSEEDFKLVSDFIERCRFNWMGSFLYSREEGTAAYRLTTEAEHKELIKKAKRWQKKLEKTQEAITKELLAGFTGKEYPVLIEELIEGKDLAIGRMYAQAPEVDGLTVVTGRGMVPGQVYRCGITRVNGLDLEAIKLEAINLKT